MKIVVTNNPLVSFKVSEAELDFHKTDYLGVLKAVRDKIHLGHKLLTHPLAGSVKPWETPYKTVILTSDKAELDNEALFIIENCIEMCQKSIVGTNRSHLNESFKNDLNCLYSDDVLADYQLIDYNLIFGKD